MMCVVLCFAVVETTMLLAMHGLGGIETLGRRAPRTGQIQLVGIHLFDALVRRGIHFASSGAAVGGETFLIGERDGSDFTSEFYDDVFVLGAEVHKLLFHILFISLQLLVLTRQRCNLVLQSLDLFLQFQSGI